MDRGQLFLECFVKFFCETIWSRTFVYWELLDYSSISLAIIGLFKFSASSPFRFRRLYFYGNLSISPRFPNFLGYSSSQQFLSTLCVSVVSVGISPLSFLIVFIYVLSLFALMSLFKDLSILFIFSKNQVLDLLIARIWF